MLRDIIQHTLSIQDYIKGLITDHYANSNCSYVFLHVQSEVSCKGIESECSIESVCTQSL